MDLNTSFAPLSELLAKAARDDDVQAIEALLAQGANAAVPVQLGVLGARALPLVHAIYFGSTQAALALVPRSGSLEWSHVSLSENADPLVNSPLALAILRGNLAVALSLASSRDADSMMPDRWTALEYAAFHGEANILQALLPWVGAPKDSAALRLACSQGEAECARILLPLCDPLERGPDGATALMAAAQIIPENMPCVELLLPVSDLGAQDFDGFDAAALARSCCADRVAARIESFAAAQKERAELDDHALGASARAIRPRI
jgi:hypothetical protein